MFDDPYVLRFNSQHVAYQIGVLCIAWSGLEHLINSLLSVYLQLGDPQKSDVFMGSLDMRRKIVLIKPLALLSDPPEIYLGMEKYLDFIDNTIRPERNRYVHDIYHFSWPETTLTNFRTRLSRPSATERILSVSSNRNITPDQIEEVADDIESCASFASTRMLMFAATSLPNDAPGKVNAMLTASNQWAVASELLDATIAKYTERAKSRASTSPKSSGES